ncbi:MAG: carboxymuconolactone decarboxylase family protein [Ferruginibacter sp.]|nr:carboxymuconolactone decarboxylase family protein [Ferruginibacter sp.]
MANLKLENSTISPLSTEILEKVKQTNPFLPNMYVKMANNTALLDAYIHSYDSFKANAGFTPAESQIISLVVSYENDCEYCMAAHSFVGEIMAKIPLDIIEAIRNGKEIPDAKLNALAKLTRSFTANKGKVSQHEIDDFISAGYTEENVFGIIAGIGAKIMANYANNLANPIVDVPFVSKTWKKNN